MNLAWPIYFLIPGIIIQTLLVFYVFLKKRESRVAWAFILLSIALILWQILYIFQSQAIHITYGEVSAGATMVPKELDFHHSIATFDRLQYFAIGLVAPSFLYLVMSMFVGFKDRQDAVFRIVLFSFPIVLYTLNIYSIVTSTPMIHTRYTLDEAGKYVTYRGAAYWYNVAYGYTFIALGFLLLAFKTFMPAYKLQRKQAAVFLGGTIMALFGNIQAVFLPMTSKYDMTPVFMTVGSIFFALGLLKYKMFLIEPQTEKVQEGESSFDLSMGHGFVVYEDEPCYAIEIFADMAKHSVQGLAFLPLNPDEIRERHELLRTPLLQTGEKSTPTILSYASLDERDYIIYIADRFSKDASNTIILLGGIESFAKDHPEDALKMLSDLQEITSKNNSRLLVTMPKSAVGALEAPLSTFVEL